MTLIQNMKDKVIVVGNSVSALFTACFLASQNVPVSLISLNHPLREKKANDFLPAMKCLFKDDENLSSRSTVLVSFLKELGVPFQTSEDGSLKLFPSLEKSSFTRDVLFSKTGHFRGDIAQALLGQLARFSVDCFFGWEVLSLVKNADGRCLGVTALHLHTGEVRVFHASQLVITNDSFEGLFEAPSGLHSNDGSLSGLLYRSGIPLVNMEKIGLGQTLLVSQKKKLNLGAIANEVDFFKRSADGVNLRKASPNDFPLVVSFKSSLPESVRTHLEKRLSLKAGSLRSDAVFECKSSVVKTAFPLWKDSSGQSAIDGLWLLGSQFKPEFENEIMDELAQACKVGENILRLRQIKKEPLLLSVELIGRYVDRELVKIREISSRAKNGIKISDLEADLSKIISKVSSNNHDHVLDHVMAELLEVSQKYKLVTLENEDDTYHEELISFLRFENKMEMAYVLFLSMINRQNDRKQGSDSDRIGKAFYKGPLKADFVYENVPHQLVGRVS